MRNFIRKYNQELIALLLIAGFWTSVWAYHYHQTQQANFEAAHTYEFSPNLIEPPANH